jgi:hypothetical protein
MNPVDRAILEHCLNGFNRLKPLLSTIPRGTLYRHARRLTDLVWLQRESSYFRTTPEGKREVEAAKSSHRWDHLEKLYPPIQEIPTRVHKALAELILAGIVCRQHETRDDRHPFFVAAGGTFHWKTRLGEFLCYAVGIKPGHHIVECGAETGRSLFVRKTGTGSLIYTRELLDSPLIVLDDYHAADPTARKALQPMLSGRLSVPLENDQFSIQSVPYLTLNPGSHKELEKRLGLSAAHIRRAVIANLDAVQMPDLAKMGDPAVKAAKLRGPIKLRHPQVDCEAFLHQIVTLVRSILIPEAHERVDVQLILNLASGMTSFIPDPQTAITQVCYNFGLLADTLGWVRPGWIQSVTDFTLTGESQGQSKAMANATIAVEESTPNDHPVSGRQTIDLTTPKLQRDPALPSLTLSNKLRSRLAWLEEETGRPTDELLHLLIDHYDKWRKDPTTIATLYKILQLGRLLEMKEIDIDAVHRYLIAERNLERIRCTTDDIPNAIQLLELLNSLPVAWTWGMAQNAMISVVFLLKQDIELHDVRTFLSRHQTLSQKNLDPSFIMALDKAFTQAGLQGRSRKRAIKEIVTGAALSVQVKNLEITCNRLLGKIQESEDTLKDLKLKIQVTEERLLHLKNEETQLGTKLDALTMNCQHQSSRLEIFEGFIRFLLTELPHDDPFWGELEHLLQLRQKGEITSYQVQISLSRGFLMKLEEFLTHIATKIREGHTVLP